MSVGVRWQTNHRVTRGNNKTRGYYKILYKILKVLSRGNKKHDDHYDCSKVILLTFE